MLSALLGLLLSFPAAAQADMLKIGDNFPDWSMIDQSGASVTSVSFTGRRYVLWFYPEAMTPGCTAEGRSFRDTYRQFESAGMAVVGVSFDEPETNGVFASAEGFPFPLLSDSKKELAKRVGAVEEYQDQTRPNRITYVIGEDGRVLKVYADVNPVRHAQRVLLDAGIPVEQ
jgi:peroxiredoxin Q/BCP